MYNTIVCAIVVVMLASVVVAKPRNNQTNGQTRKQYCRPRRDLPGGGGLLERDAVLLDESQESVRGGGGHAIAMFAVARIDRLNAELPCHLHLCASSRHPGGFVAFSS
jgi:hypothetical protein